MSMKKALSHFALFCITIAIATAFRCQLQVQTTVILIRHAEKDTAGGNDPELSAIGYQRAARLQAALEKYTPDAFYSTDFKRTKETILPWAKAVGQQIEIYDPKTPEAFANLLTTMTGKTMVVVGHSNTIPILVNLLAGTDEYKQLPDDEYTKIFIISINKNGNRQVKVLTY
jgi:broad specificity phosphatase PhoE